MQDFLMNKFRVYHEADTGSNGGAETTESTSDEASNDNPDDGAETTEQTEDKGIMIPKSRFDEVNENYKSIKAELDALKDSKSQADKEAEEQARKDAEAKGEFETLYNESKVQVETLTNENKSTKDRVASLENVINSLLETKLESIDKSYHDLIPGSLTPEEKLAWVNSAESKGLFGTKANANEPVGKKTNGNGSHEVDVNSLSPIQLMMNGYAD